MFPVVIKVYMKLGLFFVIYDPQMSASPLKAHSILKACRMPTNPENIFTLMKDFQFPAG